VSIWLKIVFIFIPMIFVVFPWFFEVPDSYPVVGLLDDVFILWIATSFFRYLSPKAVVKEHLVRMDRRPPIEALRHPYEDHALASGVTNLLLLVILVGSTVAVIWLGMAVLVYWIRRGHARRLLKKAVCVSAENYPDFHQALKVTPINMPKCCFQVRVVPGKTRIKTLLNTPEGFIWLISERLVRTKAPDQLAQEAARQAAHVMLGHRGLLEFIGSDITYLSRLVFHKWLRAAEESAANVAGEYLSKNGGEASSRFSTGCEAEAAI
jgi:hypothetical protein